MVAARLLAVAARVARLAVRGDCLRDIIAGETGIIRIGSAHPRVGSDAPVFVPTTWRAMGAGTFGASRVFIAACCRRAVITMIALVGRITLRVAHIGLAALQARLADAERAVVDAGAPGACGAGLIRT
eukprot:COSAG04_NODE_20865_length_384_cov_1.421053_1_plen_127_part_11